MGELGASVAAQAGASVAINGPAFLIPSLQQSRGLSLAQAGTVAAMPIAGVMVTRSSGGWRWTVSVKGSAARWTDRDRRPVRRRNDGGPTVPLCVVLFVMGMFAACTGSASGRIVVGWFPPERRGLAMGIRQMAQPRGVAVAAATIAVTADRAGVQAASVDPGRGRDARARCRVPDRARSPTPDRDPGPHREPLPGRRIPDARARVSVLLVVPQFLVWTFSLTWLVERAGLVRRGGRGAGGRHPRARRPRQDRGRAALRHGRLPGPAAALGGGAGRGDDGAARV